LQGLVLSFDGWRLALFKSYEEMEEEKWNLCKQEMITEEKNWADKKRDS